MNGPTPRLIHHTYRDDRPPADVYDPAWAESWRVHHPGWSRQLWTDTDLAWLVESAAPGHAAWFGSIRHGVVRADYGRYLILWARGGMYADLDYECLAPMGDVATGLFLSWDSPAADLINTALVGAPPGLLLFRAAMNECVRRYRPSTSPHRIHEATGPRMFTDLVRRLGLVAAVRPGAEFSPLDWRRDEALSLGMTRTRAAELRAGAIAAGARAITYWAGNWNLGT